MTAIAAWADSRGVWMAADGNSCVSDDIVNHTTRKIARRPQPSCFTDRPGGDVLVALSGTARIRRAIDHVNIAATPNPGDDRDCDNWAHTVCEAIIDAALDSKTPPSRDGDSNTLACALLLGWAGRLWYCDGSDYAQPIDGGYMTIGSGADVALGALHVQAPAVRDRSLDPATAVVRAIEAAASWIVGIGGSITTEHAENLP